MPITQGAVLDIKETYYRNFVEEVALKFKKATAEILTYDIKPLKLFLQSVPPFPFSFVGQPYQEENLNLPKDACETINEVLYTLNFLMERWPAQMIWQMFFLPDAYRISWEDFSYPHKHYVYVSGLEAFYKNYTIYVARKEAEKEEQ